jgi:cyanate permease
MDTAASLSAGLTTTPVRGWLVVLLSRLQGSSVVLISYSFGIFLPFIHTDLQLSSLEAGLLQSAPVQGLQHALETLQETPLRALRAYPQGWLVGVTMLALSATWTTIVTFLPTLLLKQHGMPPGQSGPLFGCLYYGLIP